MTRLSREFQLATTQWDRYNNGMTRGHIEYQRQARLNEDFYLGGGRQWDKDIKQALEAAGRPWLEENIIFSTINTVLGYQTQSRLDIAFKPRESDDQSISDLLTKLSMFVIDQNKIPWLESQVFADGLIQQRGYFDIKIDFSDNLYGDIKMETLDPLDVIPDPDGKSYDPDDWSDVIVTRWMSLDDIKETYGLTKWRRVLHHMDDEADWGADSLGEERNKFGGATVYHAFFKDGAQNEHARIIDRQYWKLQNREFFFDLVTGEILPVPAGMTNSDKKKAARSQGSEIIRKLIKRVRWTVSTRDVVLHDEWSPYDHFTVVPYYPYFRRGVTVGLVDNLIKTQEMLNKVYSQILHIVNSTANSGWIVEENSLVNMDIEDLEDVGSQTGLVIEYKTGRTAPNKIEPNQIPSGLKDLITSGIDLIRLISGVSETFQGGGGPEVSGTAIQSRVQQAAVQLATPIDNLFRTRHMLAERILKLLQQFYTEERTFLITRNTEDNQEVSEGVTINQEDEEGNLINDITAGKYDVVITDVPTAVTFQNAQFAQAIEMRKFGVEIPDDEMVKMSTLARKNEIAKKLEGGPTEEQQALQQEEIELQMETLRKEIEKLQAEAKSKETASIKQIAEVSQMISENPSIAPMIDQLLRSVDGDLEEETLPEPEEPVVSEEQDFNQQLGQI